MGCGEIPWTISSAPSAAKQIRVQAVALFHSTARSDAPTKRLPRIQPTCGRRPRPARNEPFYHQSPDKMNWSAVDVEGDCSVRGLIGFRVLISDVQVSSLRFFCSIRATASEQYSPGFGRPNQATKTHDIHTM